MLQSVSQTSRRESPEYVKLSLAAAMILGLKPGRFHRDARLGCVNLLLTYGEGCAANCSYCGLARGRDGSYEDKSFIRVSWPVYSMGEVRERIADHRHRVSRICVSMITHRRSREDTLRLLQELEPLGIPLSLLCIPTLMKVEDLEAYRDRGAGRLGIALDAANPRLFSLHRGAGVAGPHVWEQYWRIFDRGVAVFGPGNVGVHLIAGLGETEEELVRLMAEIRERGGCTHLFSFCPEPGSALAREGAVPPPMPSYRRIQLARFMIDVQGRAAGQFTFALDGTMKDAGLTGEEMDEILQDGRAFQTSGCPDETTGAVACTRPFGNSPPGPMVRNLPYALDDEDRAVIREALSSITRHPQTRSAR